MRWTRKSRVGQVFTSAELRRVHNLFCIPEQMGEPSCLVHLGRFPWPDYAFCSHTYSRDLLCYFGSWDNGWYLPILYTSNYPEGIDHIVGDILATNQNIMYYIELVRLRILAWQPSDAFRWRPSWIWSGSTKDISWELSWVYTYFRNVFWLQNSP